jgi:hypothetical protein
MLLNSIGVPVKGLGDHHSQPSDCISQPGYSRDLDETLQATDCVEVDTVLE